MNSGDAATRTSSTWDFTGRHSCTAPG
jgi:hypothetical protein